VSDEDAQGRTHVIKQLAPKQQEGTESIVQEPSQRFFSAVKTCVGADDGVGCLLPTSHAHTDVYKNNHPTDQGVGRWGGSWIWGWVGWGEVGTDELGLLWMSDALEPYRLMDMPGSDAKRVLGIRAGPFANVIIVLVNDWQI